jgi:hypothetical protein
LGSADDFEGQGVGLGDLGPGDHVNDRRGGSEGGEDLGLLDMEESGEERGHTATRSMMLLP